MKAPSPRVDGKRAASRWLVVSAVLGLFAVLYFQHPYYRGGQFTPWRAVFPFLAGAWLVLGVPYSFVTLRRFESKGARAFWITDGALHLLVVARAIWGRSPLKLGLLWRRKRIKTTLLAMVVKGFFTPLMTGFLSGHLTSISNAWARRKGIGTLPILANDQLSLHSFTEYMGKLATTLKNLLPNGSDFGALFSRGFYTLPNVRFSLDMAYDFIFIVDCGIALIGYTCESRWLGNKTKSVEPTGIGWACALACYPPFNNVLGTYLPFADGKALVENEVGLLVIKGCIVLLFAVYAWATVAIGVRFSNLTNRGVVSRGPYRFMRHPAYATKCTAWWLEHLAHLTPQTALALIGLCSVYALRAWTEERHLSADPDYVAYKKRVRFVAIPRIL